jgi:ABC-2 type transport system ATP-binding protein
VLDEPTNGLDPQGIANTRELLLRWVAEHDATVLVSSHLLDGVRQLCSDVAFMQGGRIVHRGKMQELVAPRSKFRVRVDNPDDAVAVLRAAADAAGWTLTDCERADDGVLVVSADGDPDLAAVNRALVEHGLGVSQLVTQSVSLEDLYRSVIGGEGEVRWGE